jgi:hypothetical protein
LVCAEYKHLFPLDIHQENAQINNKAQLAPYHSQSLNMFRLSMSRHQGFSNSAFQMLDRSANEIAFEKHYWKTPDDGS